MAGGREPLASGSDRPTVPLDPFRERPIMSLSDLSRRRLLMNEPCMGGVIPFIAELKEFRLRYLLRRRAIAASFLNAAKNVMAKLSAAREQVKG